MASDAFFPFRDGIDAAAEAGISCVIQPGGSMRDQEVIDAADEHGMCDGVHQHASFPSLMESGAADGGGLALCCLLSTDYATACPEEGARHDDAFQATPAPDK
jgi:hypothetical protein